MELWIRSQDKLKLVKVNYFYISDCENFTDIVGETIDSGPIIARYKTKERALEVLDEIQKAINNSGVPKQEYNINSGSYHTIKEYVYEMPKD